MGTDKASLQLAGKPLIQHAVVKLRRICSAVSIVSGDSRLSGFAPTVGDLHPGCGPLGGVEAALVHTRHDWNLILPVDVPFLPSALLLSWAGRVVASGQRGTRMALFEVHGIRHPTVLVIHREVVPFLTDARAHGQCRLGPALHAAARRLESEHELCPPGHALQVWGGETGCRFETTEGDPPGPGWTVPTAAQQHLRDLWFANLNTPEDFAWAEQHANALDT